MSEKHSFRAVIENPGGGGAFVRVPFDVEQAFGRKRVPVLATIDDEPYRGTLVRMGEPCHILIVLKEIRQKIGKDFGDEVLITLEEDTQPRLVDIPEDFQQALDEDPEAKAAFEALSYTHRREHVRTILDAKHEKTRRKRIVKSLMMLKTQK